jgi:hypothetical protein
MQDQMSLIFLGLQVLVVVYGVEDTLTTTNLYSFLEKRNIVGVFWRCSIDYDNFLFFKHSSRTLGF